MAGEKQLNITLYWDDVDAEEDIQHLLLPGTHAHTVYTFDEVVDLFMTGSSLSFDAISPELISYIEDNIYPGGDFAELGTGRLVSVAVTDA